MSVVYMGHVGCLHGACQLSTWGMSVLYMGCVGSLHGVCRLFTRDMSVVYMGHVGCLHDLHGHVRCLLGASPLFTWGRPAGRLLRCDRLVSKRVHASGVDFPRVEAET